MFYAGNLCQDELCDFRVPFLCGERASKQFVKPIRRENFEGPLVQKFGHRLGGMPVLSLFFLSIMSNLVPQRTSIIPLRIIVLLFRGIEWSN
jgi:hypothetical protein